MKDFRPSLQKQSMKYLVIALAVANCAGIYAAHDRLTRPYAGPSVDSGASSIDFADAASALSDTAEATMTAFSAASDVKLGIDAGPRPETLAVSGVLPELAALPPVKAEVAPVVPSVPARNARLGMSESRSARLEAAPARTQRIRAARPQAERTFDHAFTPDYAALAPYDGSAETSSLGASAPAEPLGAVESMTVAPVEAGPVEAMAPAMDAPASDIAPVELPAVEITAPVVGTPG